MLIGYTRVSTAEQSLYFQPDVVVKVSPPRHIPAVHSRPKVRFRAAYKSG